MSLDVVPFNITAEERRARYGTPDRALMLVDADLFIDLFERANPGAKFTVEWGEKRHSSVDVYDPSFTRHYPDAV